MTKALTLLLLTALMLPLSLAAERDHETRIHEKNIRHPRRRPAQRHCRTPEKATRCRHHQR